MRRALVALVVAIASVVAVSSVDAQTTRVCALFVPAPAPPEGVDGYAFVAQIPGAYSGEEQNYRATVDFGDGTPPATGIVPEPLGGGVGAPHAYRRAGPTPPGPR